MLGLICRWPFEMVVKRICTIYQNLSFSHRIKICLTIYPEHWLYYLFTVCRWSGRWFTCPARLVRLKTAMTGRSAWSWDTPTQGGDSKTLLHTPPTFKCLDNQQTRFHDCYYQIERQFGAGRCVTSQQHRTLPAWNITPPRQLRQIADLHFSANSSKGFICIMFERLRICILQVY